MGILRGKKIVSGQKKEELKYGESSTCPENLPCPIPLGEPFGIAHSRMEIPVLTLGHAPACMALTLVDISHHVPVCLTLLR